MRDFERATSRLRRLPLLGRLIYSIFLVFTLGALALTAWLTEDMVGLDLSGLDGYYAGAPPEAVGTEPLPDGPDIELGPDIAMPDDLALDAGEPLSQRKLLEVTHFHLFSMPVYLLILSHLFMLSGAGHRSKLGFITGGTVGVVLHLAAPWVATGGGGLAAVLYGASGALMLVAFAWMSALPLWEMWAPTPDERS